MCFNKIHSLLPPNHKTRRLTCKVELTMQLQIQQTERKQSSRIKTTLNVFILLNTDSIKPSSVTLKPQAIAVVI